jgi:hypothetical protein
MDTGISQMVLTLEDFKDPEKRAAYEEASSVKVLQKNLASAIQEARNSIETFKEQSHNCNLEMLMLKENHEKEVGMIEPQFHLEIEDLIDKLRNEIIGQNSENMKFNKQTQQLVREKNVLQQLTHESTAKFDKIEDSMSVR